MRLSMAHPSHKRSAAAQSHCGGQAERSPARTTTRAHCTSRQVVVDRKALRNDNTSQICKGNPKRCARRPERNTARTEGKQSLTSWAKRMNPSASPIIHRPFETCSGKLRLTRCCTQCCSTCCQMVSGKPLSLHAFCNGSPHLQVVNLRMPRPSRHLVGPDSLHNMARAVSRHVACRQRMASDIHPFRLSGC